MAAAPGDASCDSTSLQSREESQWLCRADDVQVEFIMLDPYQRITLKHNNEVCSSPGSVFRLC